MTREQMDAIRARYADEPLLGEMRTDRFGNLITVTREHPVVTLLAEVDRLKNELAMAVQVSGELCQTCGWAMKFPDEPCRCELLAEVERMKGLLDTATVNHIESQLNGAREAIARKDAFKRGVAAMREAAASSLTCHFPKARTDGARCGLCTLCEGNYAQHIRALPDPEDE